MPATNWPNFPGEMETFYGKHELDANGKPTAAWESKNLVTFKAPYVMKTSWDGKPVKHIRCHKKVKDSLESILKKILSNVYKGDLEKLKKDNMNIFGGCYEYRKISGGTALSSHSWGAAIDLDPAHNPQGSTEFSMPKAVVKLFEDEGWVWGGIWPDKKKDAMHFQACKS